MRNLIIAAMALSLVGLAGCTQADKAEVNEQVAGAREELNEATARAQQAAANAALEARVKTALETRKGLDVRGLDVEAKNGMVTLKGNIPSRDQAELAERTAMETQGVQSVQNHLMVPVPAKSLPSTPAPSTTVPSTTTPSTEAPATTAPSSGGY